jgi:polar amino acid transport system substrate-binding protein
MELFVGEHHLISVRMLPAIALLATLQVNAASLTFLSEQNPPVNYEDSRQKAAGFSVELLQLVWQQMSISPQPIKFLPWARAFYITQVQPNTVLFATSRIPDRENMFKWVCPISSSAVALFRRNSDRFDLKSYSTNDTFSIGVVRADIAEDVVTTKAYNKHRLVKARNIEQLIRLLQSQKVDMVAAYEPVIYTTMQRMGLSPADYPRELVLQKMTDCFAFNRATSDEVINDYQNALSAVQNSQQYRELVSRYHMLDFN